MRFPLPKVSTARLRVGLIASVIAIAASTTVVHAQSVPLAADTDAMTATMKIEPPQPQWGFIRGGFNSEGTSIFDGTSGKMRGMVDTSRNSDMALDPLGKYYYVSETIWSKGYRGTRQDMVSVYDATDLKLVTEIAMPGRLLIGGRKQNFIVSEDGKTGFVYNMDPASSVNVIDLVKRRFVQAIELPGCASLIPNPGVGFSALCSDGSMATVAVSAKSAKITRSAPFFPASDDPIFDNFAYDPARDDVTMLSYTGLVYQAKIGAKPEVAAPWSIQEAAGLRTGDTKPSNINWLPGGYQPMALNRKTGHLYILMHAGEYWSHKAPGTEIWDVDLAAKKVVKRHTLETPVMNIEVTQSDTPLIFINGEEGKTWVIDATTWESKHEIKDAGSGILFTMIPG